MTTTAALTWQPTAHEVEAILESMRPLIQRFADRDRRLLAARVPAGWCDRSSR